MTFGINFSLELNHFNPQPRKYNQKVNPDRKTNIRTLPKIKSNSLLNSLPIIITIELESFIILPRMNVGGVDTFSMKCISRQKIYHVTERRFTSVCLVYLHLSPAILCGKWHGVPQDSLPDIVIYVIDRYFKMAKSGLKSDELAVIHRILGGKLSKGEIQWLSQQALAGNEK